MSVINKIKTSLFNKVKRGKYIFGIINSNKNISFTHHLGEFFDGKEEENNFVYTIAYKDVSVVTSDLEIPAYTHMGKEALAMLLVRDQKVVEKIMCLNYTIIPVKFGTFVASADEGRNILVKGYPIIREIFSKIFNKIEIDLTAYWNNFTLVLKEIGEEGEIKELKEKLLANSKANVACCGIDNQMKIGSMIERVLSNRRKKYALQIQNALKGICQDLKIHDLYDSKMIANFAFLIDKKNQGHFDRKVEELNARFEEKLNFKCVGPLPPYNFYMLEIRRLQFEEIDWARKRLGILNDSTNRNEIEKAHKKLALTFHPDRKVNVKNSDPAVAANLAKVAAKEFDEITRAYKMLVAYCQACEQEGKRKNYYFSREEFKKNAILVGVRK